MISNQVLQNTLEGLKEISRTEFCVIDTDGKVLASTFSDFEIQPADIQAFVESTQKYVTGEVKLKLYKGNIIKAGTTSPYSLYNESLASFTTGDMYDHHDADGFITLFGLPLKVRAMKLLEVEQNKNNK
mgnify:CR=1 FL=1